MYLHPTLAVTPERVALGLLDVFAHDEWRAVYLVTQRKPPPDEPPSLDTMVRMVATLGGFLNRKADGFPGPKTLWIGLQRVPDFVLALEAQRGISDSCG